MDQREVLIRDIMQFLLQRNEQRFSKQLFGHLIDESCNLPLVLAKPRFYAFMISGLKERLPPEKRKAFERKYPVDGSRFMHYQFNTAISYLRSTIKNSEKIMALQVIESIEQIKKEWLRNDDFFTSDLKSFEAHLKEIIDMFSRNPTAPRLAEMPIEQIRRRLNISLTTALLRYVTEPKSFDSEFGSVPQILKAMQNDHSVFCRVMAYFSSQIPYFTLLASQTFWRTIGSLMTENELRM